VAAADTILLEIALKILSCNTGLHARHHILFVDPFYCVHSGHI
jgi:hypothetical protein